VKQFEEKTNLKAYILLDTSASMATRAGAGLTKLQYASYCRLPELSDGEQRDSVAW